MKFNIKPNGKTLVAVGIGVANVALALLNNKKEAADRAAMKEDILKEIMKDLPKNDQN